MKISLDEPAGPGTHALVIGVSRYPHTDELEDLSSAARSAAEIAAWLLHEYHNPYAPLASLHLLLSPARGEKLPGDVAALVPARRRVATRAAVEQDLISFKELCLDHPDDVAFVYVAGHGVQLTSQGAVLLLEDYGAPRQPGPLHGAIDMVNFHRSLNGYRYPSKQFWFVDACRQPPAIAAQFEELVATLPPGDKPVGDVDSSPLFLAASPHEKAFARKGGQTLFSIALLSALRGGAARGPDETCEMWNVPVSRLLETLDPAIRELMGSGDLAQRVDPTGRVRQAIVHYFAQAPRVAVQLTLSPEQAAGTAVGSLVRGRDCLIGPASDWPLRGEVPAGLYSVVVQAEPPYRSVMGEPVQVWPPPDFEYQIEVS